MKYLYNSLSGIVVGGNITAGTTRTQLSKPHGLFFESSSNSILIANTGANNTVNDIQWSIIIGDSNGGGGNSSSSLFFPTDIMLDPMDNMYIVDRYNHRVQFFSVDQLNGTTIAGQSGQSGVNSTGYFHQKTTTCTKFSFDSNETFIVDRGSNSECFHKKKFFFKLFFSWRKMLISVRSVNAKNDVTVQYFCISSQIRN